MYDPDLEWSVDVECDADIGPGVARVAALRPERAGERVISAVQPHAERAARACTPTHPVGQPQTHARRGRAGAWGGGGRVLGMGQGRTDQQRPTSASHPRGGGVGEQVGTSCSNKPYMIVIQ